MKLARSSFYYKPKGNGHERMKADADLRDRIEAICLESPRYGYRRVTHELRHKDCHVNHKKVLKIMRESDLLCRVRHRRVTLDVDAHLVETGQGKCPVLLRRLPGLSAYGGRVGRDRAGIG